MDVWWRVTKTACSGDGLARQGNAACSILTQELLSSFVRTFLSVVLLLRLRL